MAVTRASVPDTFVLERLGETMKSILLSALLFLAITVTGNAQAPPVSAPAPATTFSVSGNDAAMIVLQAGTQSLTPAETTTLRSAMFNVYQAIPDLATARKALLQASAGIAASHGAPSSGPYSITGDFSVQISVASPNSPAVNSATAWKKVASAGQAVLIKAGTTVRFGAPIGAPPNDPSVQAPLATNSFAPQVTFPADTVITVGPAAFGSIDPAPNYVKELDMLGTSGGVTVVTGR
jgi:hypothetical protein